MLAGCVLWTVLYSTGTHTYPGEAVTHKHSYSHNKLRQSHTSSSPSPPFPSNSSLISSAPSLLMSCPLPLWYSSPPQSSQWFSLSVTKGPSTLKIPDGAYASNTTQHAYPSLPPSLPLSPLISNTLSLLPGLPVVWRSPPLIQFKLNVEVKDASKCPAFPLLACLVVWYFFHFLFHFSCSRPVSQGSFSPFLVTLEAWHHSVPSLSFYSFFSSASHPISVSFIGNYKHCMLNIWQFVIFFNFQI